ncbi:MAG: Mevalonate diphosphate decarboxylase [candidate division TM6 bacterium GW2011_GWF2_37_49]|nr:MAG: Mevalonate diphosphate decarboxylase [candidate division TM6 bacterium GW2011_GWF2_37_49]
MNYATTKACANIALIKYWGKRNEDLMLPTKSSLSVSLEALSTLTKIRFSDADSLLINGINVEGYALAKLIKFLNKFRQKFGINKYFTVDSSNNFPTAAGLASSSSAFAALAQALNDLCALNLDKKELSMVARLGSGSASRSVYGGFVVWHKGSMDDGSDCFAKQLFDAGHWPEFRIIVVVVQSAQKKISSSNGMQITVATSKSYTDWIMRSELRLNDMIEAIRQKNIESVGTLAELDCLEMHQAMQDSTPAINYFNDKTVAVMDMVKFLREFGIQCYFTIDAGPNVKIITDASNQESVLDKLKTIDGIEQIIVSKIA